MAGPKTPFTTCSTGNSRPVQKALYDRHYITGKLFALGLIMSGCKLKRRERLRLDFVALGFCPPCSEGLVLRRQALQ